MNTGLGLQSPWVTLYNKIYFMFNNDEDLDISNLIESDGNYSMTIASNNTTKLKAIEKILKHEFPMGNITFKINFVYGENESDNITISDIKNAFNGNTVISTIKTAMTPAQDELTFVLFNREVVQFYNDDISDFYGNYNGLAEDIAREIFNTQFDINYCTDIIPAD